MAYDKFLIGPFETGKQTNLRPLWINEDAFVEIVNAYVFRGRVRKRPGGRFMGTGWPTAQMEPLYSRFRVQVGTIGVPVSPVPGTQFNVGQQFSAGSQIFTVVSSTPGVQPMLSTGPGTGTFDVATGAFALAGTGLAAGTAIFWYPALPVMNLTTYSQIGSSINNEPSYGFDTQFVYVFTGGAWRRETSPGSPTWQGDNLDFYWDTNYLDPSTGLVYLFVTNFNATIGAPAVTDDPIYYFDGSTWTVFQPYFSPTSTPTSGPFVKTARMIVSFKNSLLLLNTIENDGSGGGGINTAYPQRCRFSAPKISAIAANAYYEPNTQDNTGNLALGGGFIDAPTTELMISSEFIKDRLIVEFERSTWEIYYTGNDQEPFRWAKINTELGCEATFSTVPFDKVVVTMANVGVHACTGANVERIDQKIPDQVFEILNLNDAQERTYGIRDFFVEQIYWTFCSDREGTTFTYPDSVLVFNYKTQSWALLDDCITVFGYFNQQNAILWNSTSLTWSSAAMTWSSGTNEAIHRQVIAGTPEGFVFIVDSEIPRNAKCWQITNMAIVPNSGDKVTLTIIDHTLAEPSPYIAIENAKYSIGTTSGAGAASGVTSASIGDSFIIGTQTYNIVAASGALQTVGAGSGTFNVATGAYTFTGAVALATIYLVINVPAIYAVVTIVDADNIIIQSLDIYTRLNSLSEVYVGGGWATRVSRISLNSKQWNPYLDSGVDFYLAKIDFGVWKTEDGQITVDYSPSATPISMLNDGGSTGTNCLQGNGILETTPYDPTLYPLEQFQQRLWHQIYFQTFGECIQIRMYLSDTQISNPDIAWEDFNMEGMILSTQRTSMRLE